MSEKSKLLDGIPKGNFRVIEVDPISGREFLEGDYAKKEEAFRIADEKNKERRKAMGNVRYVYDDTGECIRRPLDVDVAA